MEIENLLDVTTREGLREWLITNSSSEKCCWVIVTVTPKEGVVTYLDAVEEAMCFGWIDGVKKKINDTQLAQRLSPRGVKSNWTELNKERVRRLERLGMMTEAGRAVLPDMDTDNFKIDDVIEERLTDEADTYANFLGFPEIYQRIRIDTIQSVKKDTETFEKRLDKFMENTRNNKMYGPWDDKGRLVDKTK